MLHHESYDHISDHKAWFVGFRHREKENCTRERNRECMMGERKGEGGESCEITYVTGQSLQAVLPRFGNFPAGQSTQVARAPWSLLLYFPD